MPSPITQSEDDNLWSKILTEVQSRSSAALPQAAVIVLGDNNSGKTSLVGRLQHKEQPSKGAGLEYHILEVNPDYKDGTYAYQLGSALPDVGPGESARLGLYVLDGDPVFAPLLVHAIKPTLLERTLVIITVNMEEPWSIMQNLEKWTKVLNDHLQLYSMYDKNSLKDCRDKQVRFWQEYVEPLDSSSHSDAGAKVPSMETDHILLPLGETTLTTNIGLDIIVSVNKCDSISKLEKDHDYKEYHFDFIQQHIRKFCLSFGAALVYTSAKENRNCDTLYKYILHRLYQFPFTHPALVVEKESVFIPAGWDNDKKISILFENLHDLNPDDTYSDHVKKPMIRKPNYRDQEIRAEDDQIFLQSNAAAFAVGAPSQGSKVPGGGGSSGKTPSATPDSPSLHPRPSKPSPSPVTKPPAKPIDPTKPNQNEGVLAQFFNNLLKSKEDSPNDSSTSLRDTSGSASLDSSRMDESLANAELTRILAEGQRGNGETGGNESTTNGAKVNSNITAAGGGTDGGAPK